MPAAHACPDRSLLEQFLVGRIAAPDCERLEQHIAACSQCAETLHSLRADDPLVEALRHAHEGGAVPSPDLVAAMIPWLKRLRPAGATQTLAPVGDAETPQPGMTFPSFDFLAPAQAPGEVGRLGPYRVLAPIGAGGMGVVFLAEDIRLKRAVALKVIKPDLLPRRELRERFIKEAQAAAAVEHDHIVTIFQADEIAGVPFLAMPLLQGETLEARLQRTAGPLPIDDVLSIGREIAEGLAAAHARGLIHRDIKPGNIWLQSNDERGTMNDDAKPSSSDSSLIIHRSSLGRVKILDFGLACTLEADTAGGASALVGTPAYMAPEQARGAGADARADLFSLGCVLYRMAAGQPPFQGRDAITTLVEVASRQPPAVRTLNPAVPVELAAVIDRLLVKNAGERCPSAQAVVDTLGAIEHARRPKPSRLRWLLATAALLAVAVGLTVWLLPGAPPPAKPVEVAFDYDQPEARFLLQLGDDPAREINLRKKSTLTLPPGDYVVKAIPARDNREQELEPNSFTVNPDTPLKLRLHLVGEIRRHKEHSGPVWAVALSPTKGSLVALSAGGEHTLGLWDAARDDGPRFLGGDGEDAGHQSPVRCVAFSPDGKRTASGSGAAGPRADLSIRFWDLEHGVPTGRLIPPEKSWVTALAYSPDGKRLLSGGSDGTIHLWDLQNHTLLHALIGHDGLGVHALAFAPDGRRALSAGGDKQVLLWDTETFGKTVLAGHTDRVAAVAWAPDRRTAASAGWDRTLRLWDLRAQKSRTVSAGQGPVRALAYAPDGKRLLTGGDDGTLRLWDTATLEVLHVFRGHKQAVTGIAFSADSRRAVSSSIDGTVRLWELPYVK